MAKRTSTHIALALLVGSALLSVALALGTCSCTGTCGSTSPFRCSTLTGTCPNWCWRCQNTAVTSRGMTSQCRTCGALAPAGREIDCQRCFTDSRADKNPTSMIDGCLECVPYNSFDNCLFCQRGAADVKARMTQCQAECLADTAIPQSAKWVCERCTLDAGASDAKRSYCYDCVAQEPTNSVSVNVCHECNKYSADVSISEQCVFCWQGVRSLTTNTDQCLGCVRDTSLDASGQSMCLSCAALGYASSYDCAQCAKNRPDDFEACVQCLASPPNNNAWCCHTGQC